MDRVYKLYLKMHKSKNAIFRKLIHLYLRVVYSCDIMPDVIIGNNTRFAHNGLGVVIHPDAIIGKNCKISQGVTIGGRNGYAVVPQIGDNVSIGAHAILLGPIKIGDNAQIGAGSVVVKSIPPRAVVVGNPAHIIRYLD